MRAYRYRSPIGAFLIKPQTGGRWGLWLKDDLLGSYHSPMAASDDVYMQATGDAEWDLMEGLDIPTDLSEWQRI